MLLDRAADEEKGGVRPGLPQSGGGGGDTFGRRAVVKAKRDERRASLDMADRLAGKRKAAGVRKPEQPIAEQQQDQQAG
jgi:hypothetical protein